MKRTLLALSVAALTAAPFDAAALPEVGGALPVFQVLDLTGRPHDSRELVGRTTLVIAGSDTDADEALRAWGAAADRRLPATARRVTVLAFDLAFFIPASAARGMARDRSPANLWSSTWLDSSGDLRPSFGLPESEVPFAFVLDARGRVVASAHCAVSAPAAEAIWRALGG